MASKTGVQKVKESNIEKFVTSMTFVGTIAAEMNQDYDIQQNNNFTKPSYQQEINKIIQMWNVELGNTWAKVITPKTRLRVLKGEIIPQNDYPWRKIDRALQDFDGWFEKHSEIFKIDHTFSRKPEFHVDINKN